MSNEHQKQPAGAGNATGSAASESASGDQALSESNLDAVTGGAGDGASKSLNLNIDDDSKAVFIATDNQVFGVVIPAARPDSGSGKS